MLKTVYILILIFCTQLFVVGQDLSIDELLFEAEEIVTDNPEKSIKLTNSAFSLAQEAGDMYRMVSAKTVMGYISMMTNDYAVAYVNYNDALKFLERADTIDLFKKVAILNNMAIIKSSYDDHDGAVLLYELAHKTAIQYVDENRELAEEYGDLQLLVDLPYDMATELKHEGKYLEAGDILVELWEDSEFKNDTILLAKVVNQLGQIKVLNGEYSKALEFFATAAFNEGIEPSIRAIAMHNLASTYKDQEDYEKADKYYTEAIELKLEYSNEKSQFITMLEQGELAFAKGDFGAATERWETALSTFDGIKNDPDLFVIHDWLQKAYLKTDLEKASLYGNLYSTNIKDWMTVRSSQKDNAPTLQALNTRVDGIMADRQLKAERLAMLKRYWPFGIVALLLIMLLVYSVQVSFNKRRERILEESLKVDRASVASEILNKIRRD